MIEIGNPSPIYLWKSTVNDLLKDIRNDIILEVKTVVKIVVDSHIKELVLPLTTQVKLAIVAKKSLSMSSSPTLTPDDFDHEVEQTTQSPSEETKNIQPTPMELETNPRKIKVHKASEDTTASPNVTPTRTVRPQ